MNWFILFCAGLLEIVWAIGLKYSDGFTKPLSSIITIISAILSLGLLSLAMKGLPLGTAYAIWVGIGTVGTAVCGILLFDESADSMRMISLTLIVLGIIGLKLTTPR